MEIRKVSVDKIIPAEYNPRKDLQPTDEEYVKIQRSIETFGYVEPIVWNEQTGHIVGGHQRFKVIKDTGATEVEVSVINVSLDEEKALNIALNKISGEWDEDKLSELLEELRDSDIDELLTGFDESEIDHILSATDDNMDLDDFFEESEQAEAQPKMTVCPFCGKEHEV